LCVPDALLFCVVVNLVICISLGLLYIFVVHFRGFDFVVFFSTSQEIGWEEHLRNDLFCVKWDLPLNLCGRYVGLELEGKLAELLNYVVLCSIM